MNLFKPLITGINKNVYNFGYNQKIRIIRQGLDLIIPKNPTIRFEADWNFQC